jgi:hypothetical protein
MLCICLCVIAELTPYTAALERLQAGRGGSVEATFEAAVAGGEALLPKIEDLPRLEPVPGMVLNNEEILIATPDAEFFLALARKHGDRVDVEFFENYAATFPDSVWPSYIEQQTDVTGCTRFGAGELTARYAGWLAFRAHHPKRYVRAVAERLADIERQISESTCSCGTKEETLAELAELARRFHLHARAQEMRFQCNAY